MSRIADARARAGFTLPDEDAMRWDAESRAAAALLGDMANCQLPTPNSQLPTPNSHVTTSKPETIDFELAAAIRRIFLAAESTVRSVMFCTVPGDGMTGVVWRAAELLAGQSGKTVAFVEDPSHRVAPSMRHGLITQIEWCDEGDAVDSAASQTNGTIGEQIGDLLPKFSFVIVNAAGTTSEELVALARQVDGAIVIVSESATRIEDAQSLVTALRQAHATLLGAILVTKNAGRESP